MNFYHIWTAAMLAMVVAIILMCIAIVLRLLILFRLFGWL